jgi:hypothetical protein
MVEETIIVGKACEWRRKNLLKCKNIIDKNTYFEITFQYVDHTSRGVEQIRLTYKILK